MHSMSDDGHVVGEIFNSLYEWADQQSHIPNYKAVCTLVNCLELAVVRLHQVKPGDATIDDIHEAIEEL